MTLKDQSGILQSLLLLLKVLFRISTRIRDSPYKQRLSSLEEGVKVKVRGHEGKFVLHEDYSKPGSTFYQEE